MFDTSQHVPLLIFSTWAIYWVSIGIPKAYILDFRKDIRSNKWFYSLVLNRDKATKDIRDYIYELQDKGIQTRPIWGLIHEQKPYQQCISYQIEKAKYYSQRIINLPCSTNIKEEDIIFIVELIHSIMG